MSFYLLQAGYSPYIENVAKKDAEDLSEPPKFSAFKKAGAKFVGFWYSSGEYYVTAVVEAPDTVDMEAIVGELNTGWGGNAFSPIRITSLLTSEEACSAMIASAQNLPESRSDMEKEIPGEQSYYKNAKFSNESVLNPDSFVSLDDLSMEDQNLDTKSDLRKD
jgi:hypothetical protein